MIPFVLMQMALGVLANLMQGFLFGAGFAVAAVLVDRKMQK